MPDFETFTKRMIPLTKAPYITIQKRGTISFNKAAHAAMGEPSAIELLYDADAKIIGFRPVEPTVEHAYPIRAIGGNTDGTFMVSGTAFTKYYGIPTVVATRRKAEMVDGVLCIDLNDAGTQVTGPRDPDRQANGHTEAPVLAPPGFATED
jgi:hypothetical protein